MHRSAKALLALLLASTPVARAETPTREPTTEELLVTAWDTELDERVEELARDGNEAAVLEPLSRHRAASLVMVQHLRKSDRLLQRKLAPVLAGYLGRRAPSSLLDDLFETEARRRADPRRAGRGPGGDARDDAVNRELEQVAERPGVAGYFDAQSVVEDIVQAAVQWCRDADRKKAGAALLRKVLERTIGGEYWNSSSAAMRGLTCDCREDSRELLSRFATPPAGAPAAEPSRPSLVQERNVARELLSGKCVAPIRSSRSGATNVDPFAGWDPRAKDRLRAFLRLAEVAK